MKANKHHKSLSTPTRLYRSTQLTAGRPMNTMKAPGCRYGLPEGQENATT